MRKLVVLVFVVVLLGGVGAAGAVFDTGEDEHVIVIVQEGDTLWEIARKHNPGMDIRKYIYLIEKRNNLSSPLIHPGQQLVLPK